MKLSEIVVNFRTDNKLSQREFAKRCSLSNSYVSFIEKETNPKTGRPMAPTLEAYKKIADCMGISVQRLFDMLDDDAPVSLAPEQLAPDEYRLVSAYRLADVKIQSAALRMLEESAEENKPKKDTGSGRTA